MNNLNYAIVCGAVVLFVLYIAVSNKKDGRFNVQMDKCIEVRNNNREIIVSQEKFDQIMRNAIQNLKQLNTNIDNENSERIAKLTKLAKAELKKFMEHNKNNKDICQYIESDDFQRETQLLANKLLKIVDIRKEDINESENIENKKLFAELILDLEQILIISGRSVCLNGKIDMSHLDKLLNTLYNPTRYNEYTKLENQYVDMIFSDIVAPLYNPRFVEHETSMTGDRDSAIAETKKVSKPSVDDVKKAMADKLNTVSQPLDDRTATSDVRKTSEFAPAMRTADATAMREEYAIKQRNIDGRTALYMNDIKPY